MKKLLLIIYSFVALGILVGAALASTVPAQLSYTKANTYVDGSALAPADITGHGIYCTFTPTTGSPIPCTFSPVSFSGAVSTGSVTLTYPASGGKACFRLTTRTTGAESAQTAESPAMCKDLPAIAPSPPGNPSITVTITINIPGEAPVTATVRAPS